MAIKSAGVEAKDTSCCMLSLGLTLKKTPLAEGILSFSFYLFLGRPSGAL